MIKTAPDGCHADGHNIAGSVWPNIMLTPAQIPNASAPGAARDQNALPVGGEQGVAHHRMDGIAEDIPRLKPRSFNGLHIVSSVVMSSALPLELLSRTLLRQRKRAFQ